MGKKKRLFNFDNVDDELTERLRLSLIKTLEKNLEAFNEETEKYGYRREKITTLDYGY